MHTYPADPITDTMQYAPPTPTTLLTSATNAVCISQEGKNSSLYKHHSKGERSQNDMELRPPAEKVANDTGLHDTEMLNSQIQFRLTRCGSVQDEATLSKKQAEDENPRYPSISDRPLFELPDDSARHSSRLCTVVSNLETSISPTPVTTVRETNTRWCKIKLALQKDRHSSMEDGYVNEGMGPV